MGDLNDMDTLEHGPPRVVIGQCQFEACRADATDRCSMCKQPTCPEHGRRIGDAYLCEKCLGRL